MVQWQDVDDDGDDTTPVQSPFGMEAVDRIAYVDNDDPVELRGADAVAAIARPPAREKPRARQPQRERKWVPADPPPEPTPRGRVLGALIRSLVAIVLFAGLIYAVFLIMDSYTADVKVPTTDPSPTISQPIEPAPESTQIP